MKKITEEQILEIKNLINTHNSIKVKMLLDKLEEAEPEDILRNELRSYLMNQGKSDISKKDIWQLLDDTKLKSGGNKMEEEQTQTEENSEKKEEDKSEDSDKEEEKEEESKDEDSDDSSED